MTQSINRPAGTQFLTVAQVAQRWACDASSVYREIQAGRLRALQIGEQAKRISLTELARYEDERTGLAS